MPGQKLDLVILVCPFQLRIFMADGERKVGGLEVFWVF